MENTSNNPKPVPAGCQLIDEVSFDGGKYTIRRLHTLKDGHTIQNWQALRYGDDWPACPYPDWRPDNLMLALFYEVVRLRERVQEFTKLEHYAARALEGINYAARALEEIHYE